jgi:hypothetical protein
MQTHRLHTPAGALSPTHSSFTVTSGVLLWGHILAMHHGSLPNTPFTNDAASAPDPYPEEEGGGGGTILSRTYTYKSAARVGEWKIRRYLSNWREEDGEGEGMEHAGWVICHEDFEAMEVLRRASGISEFGGGASLWNAHDDEGVLYVGRYDWGCGGEEGEFEEEFQKWAEEAIGPVAPQPEGWYTPKSNVMPMGYLAVVDAEEWGLEFLRAYKRDCDDVVVDEEDPPLERVFEKADGERIGAYVRMLAGEHEYGEWKSLTLSLLAAWLLTWPSQLGSSSRARSMLSLMLTSSSPSFMTGIRSFWRARLMLWNLMCKEPSKGSSLLNGNVDRLVPQV